MEKTKLTVEVDKIFFRNEEDGYTIFLGKFKSIENGKLEMGNPVIKGVFYVINIGDTIEIDGEWHTDNKGRLSFRADYYKVKMPVGIKAIEEYLRKTVKGIGKKLAKRIVGEFEEDTFEVIKNSPERLADIKGISEEKAFDIHETVLLNYEMEDMVVFFRPLGLTHTEIIDIYDNYGISAIDIVKVNPYILYEKTKLSFSSIDVVASNINIKPDDGRRIKAGIIHFIRYRMNSYGDLFVFRDMIVNQLEGFLKYTSKAYSLNYSVDKTFIDSLIDILVAEKELVIENKDDKECVYVRFYNYIENEIVKMVSELIDREKTHYSNEEIEEGIYNYQNVNQIRLAENQEKAIYMAIDSGFSILSGGPGTGKTQTINGIIDTLKYLNPDVSISLAAPTGKASDRMKEMTGMEAQTIHRLIGLRGTEEIEEIVTINPDYLIVDEASMIDAYLFYKLLTAIEENTRVLLVGDYEQLPSVGPGLILRDLINSKKIPVIILTEIFRQAKGSKIVMNSYNVVKGNKDKIEFDNDADGEFFFIRRKSEKVILKTILQSINNLINNQGYSFSDIQVLSVMRKGILGTDNLNRVLQETFNPASPEKYEIQVGNRIFRENDRVMHTVNNYDLNVFNGETGIIKKIFPDEVYVLYNHSLVIYKKRDLIELTHSYATTVHKSQGSEYPIVIMPFHSNLSILLNKNLINTAWTRAKERVVCIGDLNELYKGADRVDNIIRNSLVKDKIKQIA